MVFTYTIGLTSTLGILIKSDFDPIEKILITNKTNIVKAEWNFNSDKLVLTTHEMVDFG